jgi:hypothetical protein
MSVKHAQTFPPRDESTRQVVSCSKKSFIHLAADQTLTGLLLSHLNIGYHCESPYDRNNDQVEKDPADSVVGLGITLKDQRDRECPQSDDDQQCDEQKNLQCPSLVENFVETDDSGFDYLADFFLPVENFRSDALDALLYVLSITPNWVPLVLQI